MFWSEDLVDLFAHCELSFFKTIKILLFAFDDKMTMMIFAQFIDRLACFDGELTLGAHGGEPSEVSILYLGDHFSSIRSNHENDRYCGAILKL